MRAPRTRASRPRPRRAASRPTAGVEPVFVAPYSPSWVDRLAAGIEQLPGPYWLPYLAGFAAVLALAAAFLEGSDGRLSLQVAYTQVLPFYGFWLLHYLDRKAASALEVYRPAFLGEERELADIRWRLTTLPAAPALALSLAGLVIGGVVSASWNAFNAFQVLDRLTFIATLVFACLYAYHSIRQLRLVRQLYATRTRVDLHHVAPLYAFSSLSAQTAIGMLLLLSGAALITPEGLVGGWLTGAVVFAALAVSAFLLPLMGLHRRLAQARDDELSRITRRWQVCQEQVYRLVDAGDLEAMGAVNTALTALERARSAIERIPTWPWRAETLRSLLAALVLPILISLLQYALKRAFG